MDGKRGVGKWELWRLNQGGTHGLRLRVGAYLDERVVSLSKNSIP